MAMYHIEENTGMINFGEFSYLDYLEEKCPNNGKWMLKIL